MTIHLLAVDEDTETLEIIELFLERESDHIEVTTEPDPDLAVERVATDAIDCVVSDYRMPKLDGVELCRAVREYDPEVPFFLFTGMTDDSTHDEAEAAGVTGVVRKKTGTDHYTELAECVEAAVR